MTETRRLTARMLKTSAAGYAALAAEDMLEADAALMARYGDAAFPMWKDHLHERVTDLAAAVTHDQLRSFVQQVGWSRVAFEARGITTSDLRLSLTTLAAVLQRELPAGSAMTVRPYFDAALAALEQELPESMSALDTGDEYGQLAARYLAAILEGKRREAIDAVIGEVEAGRLGFREAHLKVLLPAQQEVGRMWHLGQVTVADEHLVTTTTQVLIARLSAAPLARRGAPGKRVLTASVEGNLHDVALTLIANFFEFDGWSVLNLGPNVPVEDLLSAVRDYSVDLVALSIALLGQCEAAERTIRALHDVERPGLSRMVVLVGGKIISQHPELGTRIGADAVGGSAEECVALGRRLVGLKD